MMYPYRGPEPPSWRNRRWVINGGMRLAFLIQDFAAWLELQGQLFEYWLWPPSGPASTKVINQWEKRAAKRRWER